ncbi:MAG TPA: hypothetical protein VK604_03015 [Bryobacteraceae bacterium]|nr:hypothetical protein [Bryobacteraceae bacterium]
MRHHTDNGVAITIELDLMSNDRLVTIEAPPPQSVAQNYDLGATKCILGGLEIPAQYRSNADYTEIARAYALAIQPLWPCASGEGRLPRLEDGYCVK